MPVKSNFDGHLLSFIYHKMDFYGRCLCKCFYRSEKCLFVFHLMEDGNKNTSKNTRAK